LNHRDLFRRAGITTFSMLALFTCPSAWADYPIMSHRYLADPGAMVYNGRVYLYNSNDDDNNGTTNYLMKSVVCVSSSDMKNWTDHGIVFQVPADASWASYSWAPVPLVRDNKFYLYFGNNASGVGVATCDSPIGEFKDPIKKYLVNSSTPGAAGTSGGWFFDPGALIDEDGKAYLSFGGNGETNGRVIQLGSDLTSTTGSAIAITTSSTNPWFEVFYLFKRSGIYYFVYSTIGAVG
jgi:arabinoxylan arabinofuranohydrolase